MSKIAIFASGSGSNAENIVKYFEGVLSKDDFHIFTNKNTAFINQRALNLNVKITSFSRNDFYSSTKIVDMLVDEKIDLIVLAGFLWLVPATLIKKFEGKIINIHPALLPKYGGKGMFGHKIHEEVVKNKETETGITIHYVDENYDEGKFILQKKITVYPEDTVEKLEHRVHELEYKFYPEVIKKLLNL